MTLKRMHDHSWAEDMDDVTAMCPDYNPGLAALGIRCPGDPCEEPRTTPAGAQPADGTSADPVTEQARKRTAELFAMADDPDWLGI